ncbi:MAG: hypothetical protein KIS79_05105 [Burkholderiales bacterium]|nr:hypothetical protein [Burkholderiales bacterium]
MVTSGLVRRLGAALDTALPRISAIWDEFTRAGFCAWYVEIDERLNIIPDAAKAEELESLQALCRAALCSFQLKDSARTDVLLSTHRQSSDFNLARQVAAVTRSRTIEALSLERQRYKNIAPADHNLPSMVAFAISQVSNAATNQGFSCGPLDDGAIKTTKPIGHSSVLIARLGELPSVGRQTRLSGITFETSIDVSKSQYSASVPRNSQFLPLHVTAMVPGVSCYLDWGFVSGAGKRESSNYVAYEPYVAGLQSSVDPFLYLALAVDSMFAMVKLIEEPLHRALTASGL